MRTMSDDVIISDEITIAITEIEFSAVRAQGAGGQNVNKVASAIHLRFDVRNSCCLPDRIKSKLLALGDKRITADGVLVVKAQEHRTQERNRRAAIQRLTELIQLVLVEKKPRKKTLPTKRAKKKRIDNKRRQGQLKQSRSRVRDD